MITKPHIHEYYVVMIDYGRKGYEATVDPDITHLDVVERIRTGEYDRIAFIHHVFGDTITDVTNEMLEESGFYDQVSQ